MLICSGERGHHAEFIVITAAKDGGEDIPLPDGIGGRTAELKNIVLCPQCQLAGDAPEEMLPLHLTLERLVLSAVCPVDSEAVCGAERLRGAHAELWPEPLQRIETK